MHSASRRQNQLRQGIDVRAFELRDVPILDDLCRQRMQKRQLLERLGVHAWPRLRSLDHRQLQLLEQQIGKLNSRIDVELPPRNIENLPLQPHDLVVELARQGP